MIKMTSSQKTAKKLSLNSHKTLKNPLKKISKKHQKFLEKHLKKSKKNLQKARHSYEKSPQSGETHSLVQLSNTTSFLNEFGKV
jgi:mRNA-degrading endonuclease RelE of RelBE toxin-antitoxin system